LQDAEDICKQNQKTLDECLVKIKANELEEKEEIRKKLGLKSINDELKDKFQHIQEERYRIEKELERVGVENKCKLADIESLKSRVEDELAKLSETFNKKMEKLEKILKKKLEKEVNIEEMDKDRKSVER
jgi:hypothetical protein